MRKAILTVTLGLCSLPIMAQKAQQAFRGYLYNNEYDVYLDIDFHHESITVPGNELYGQLPGYLGKKNNSFCWVITACDIKSDKKATLQLINDYGSEDLKATLTRKNDSIYVLQQNAGNTIKVPRNGKWQKLPKELEFKKK